MTAVHTGSTAPGADGGPDADAAPVFSIQGLWKVFGPPRKAARVPGSEHAGLAGRRTAGADRLHRRRP